MTLPTAAAALLAAAVLLPGCASGSGSGPRTPAPSEQQLDRVRASTARYQYVANAILDGYLPMGSCVDSPEGAMGQHYFNARLALAPVDPLHPAALFYVPVDGTMRLAGVEYYAIAAPVPAAPVLFGRPFDGPLPGLMANEPAHYSLHAWLFVDNPAGLYASHNPAAGCA